jgi:RND family efflux transporter MFP subunit
MKKMNYLPWASVSLLLLTGCAQKNEFQAPPPPSVSVQTPLQKDVTIYSSYPGRLAARDTVEIRARIKGYLKTINFKDGQWVKKGDLLFTIEPEEYEAAVKSAKAKLAQAQATQKLADTTLQRTKSAYKTKAVSELDVLSAEANLQSAEAQVSEAQAALDNAKRNLSYTRICAPMDGRLFRRTMSIGNLVGDGSSTLLTELIVESPIDAYFNVDERQIGRFLDQKGVEGKHALEAAPPLSLELADGSIYSHKGKLDYFDPTVDPETGTLRARAVFPNDDHRLVPGFYGKILLPRKIKGALLVPKIAVSRDMRGDYLLVVNKENKVESRYVELGEETEEYQIITKGLSKEDRVIVDGIQRARPGLLVQITPESTPSSAK